MALEWMKEAACEGVPVQYFFEEYIRDQEVYDYVNGLCKNCPVKDICLGYGKATKSIGVWGGKWLLYGVPVPTLAGMQEEWDGN